MFKKLSFLVIILALAASSGNTVELEGIHLPNALQTEYGRLILNGAGVRSKFIIKAYVAGLYLRQIESDPQKIILTDELMAIRLHVTSAMISSKIMSTAVREGFIKATQGNIAPIHSQIETFISVFKDKVNKGDIYDLIYIPGTGVEAFKNGRKQSLTKGLAFKQALFGIWLSDTPVQEDLKKELLDQ
jgi:hypothetical protein